MKNESKKTRLGSGFWLLLTAIILVCVHSIDKPVEVITYPKSEGR